MKISVITVCWNSAAFIVDSLRSVDAQTWQDKEHLIIDGASNDDTLRIVGAHAQSWRRVVSEPDEGIYDAMNKGIRLASGDVIGFINSDDLYASPVILQHVANVFRDKETEACFGDLCYVKQLDVSSVVRYWRASEFRLGSFAQGWCPPHPTFFARRAVFERLGGFDVSYRLAADWELMARYLEVGKINARYLPEVMVRMRQGGVTGRGWAGIVTQNREIWRAMNALGLRSSVVSFCLGKATLRAEQFLRASRGSRA